MNTASYLRNVAIENLEKKTKLKSGFQLRPIPLSLYLKIYEKIKNQLPSTSSAEMPSFSASHCWLERFKQRHSLQYLRLDGGLVSADSKATQQYPTKLAEITAVSSYTPVRVFNVEFGLFWFSTATFQAII